ncbi:fatty acyl-AMP ligase [Yinghuangia soli]|uniref:Fatty acyl-AMP ligase n=1 Tax=Yinghuangia soli TaxID=2908204 RepID=A0AA41Q181_9ACTN|nr:fatty acyl-AMP ligase [Yinghuangia soli]MCF2529675.1 fatty acyl-AMP ligase [Yinghuangia soli]
MTEHNVLPVDVADPGEAWDRGPRQGWPPHGADADPFDTVVRNVQRLAARVPAREAVTYVPDFPDEQPEATLTYGELDTRARQIAAWLAENCAPGDRAVLLYPNGTAFASAFFGCLYAGIVAVPAPLPLNSSGSQLRRLQRILDAAGASVVLIDAEHLPLVAESTEGTAVRCVATDAAPLGDAAAWRHRPVRRGDLAMLQFTSGSTTEPKGVMLSHENLAYTIDLIVRAFHLPPRMNTASWLPLYHDMGLIGGLLIALRKGGQAAMMSPTAFLRDPYRWLELAGRFSAGLSPAPNFAYDLCVRRIPAERALGLDLGSWLVAANGAEPVHAGTLAAFRERFAPAGFRADSMCPCYGMAEVGLFVTGNAPVEDAVVTLVHAEPLERGEFAPVAAPDEAAGAARRAAPGRSDDSAYRSLVSSGPDPFGYDARIVDPESRRELPDGRVGEIWLRGPSVALGYWGLDDETAAVFDGHTDDGEGPFLRTGDLAVRAGGQLYITGRLKELIIVRGRNIYPQDLEARLGALDPAFAAGNTVAFGVDCPDGEHVVILHELDAQKGESVPPADLAGIAIAGLTKYAGVAVANICFVAPGTIRHSTSGKKRRTHMRELFMTGALQPRYESLETAVRDGYRSTGHV